MRGLRNLDAGVERVEDEYVARQLRRQARHVYAKSLAAGLALTAIFLII